MAKTAKLSRTVKVRQCACRRSFVFPGGEVLIEKHGDKVILRQKPMGWDDFFAAPSQVPDDFLAERIDALPEEKELF